MCFYALSCTFKMLRIILQFLQATGGGGGERGGAGGGAGPPVDLATFILKPEGIQVCRDQYVLQNLHRRPGKCKET